MLFWALFLKTPSQHGHEVVLEILIPTTTRAHICLFMVSFISCKLVFMRRKYRAKVEGSGIELNPFKREHFYCRAALHITSLTRLSAAPL